MMLYSPQGFTDEQLFEISTNQYPMTQTDNVKNLGVDNPILDFGKTTVHFGSNYKAGRSFTLQITNNATPSGGDNGIRKVAIFAGLDQFVGAGNVPGLLKEGAFNDANGNSGLTGSTSDVRSILSLQKFLATRPTELRGLHISFSDISQASQSLKLMEDNPFVNNTDKILRASTEFNQYTQNDKYLLYDQLDDVLDGDTSLLYSLMPNVSVTMTFYWGATIDIKKLLNYHRANAKAVVSTLGIEAIQKMDAIAAAPNARQY
jgi:hypothetical protein